MLSKHVSALFSVTLGLYNASRGATSAVVAGASWCKSSASTFNGSCVEVARLGERIGLRDTKDHGNGPVLVFTNKEWDAFRSGVAAGEFDEI